MIDQILGQTLAGKYRIEEPWREDVVSQTYHAVQISIDKPVTIKVLRAASAKYADDVESLQTEAKILSRIANPHILNVLDVDKDEHGIAFLVLESGRGRTLREFIKDEGGSTLSRSVTIVRQIAGALIIAHSNNVIHGSLSSGNLLFAEQDGMDLIKILNFGARHKNEFEADNAFFRSNLPFYKAPEQLSSNQPIDPRTDIYALGVLLFEILTGRPPFVDENAAALTQKHLHEIPPSLIAARPDLPPNLEQVVQRALAKQPNQRFQSAAEFSEALAAFAGIGFNGNAAYSNNVEAVETGSAPLPAERQSGANNPYKTAFIVMIGIVTLSFFAIYLTGGFRNTPTIQVNADPNAQPVQPLNPASSNGEDLSNLGLQPLGNSNLNPTLVAPGGNGVPPGGIAPPMGGGIPPGLYPSGGQTVVVPGNSNSIFMGDLNSNVGYPVNGSPNRNVGVANMSVKPPVNANATPTPPARPPANSNTVQTNANLSATPIPAPTQKPSLPPTPKPNAAPAKPGGGAAESSGKSAPTGAN